MDQPAVQYVVIHMTYATKGKCSAEKEANCATRPTGCETVYIAKVL